ncbi:MAG TPA: DUF6782 family putative metallopeptidase [Patescibacteria group bacterium]|nr:DUF6782 family putative metallopeptidase [Patescibacteria group bacterium]
MAKSGRKKHAFKKSAARKRRESGLRHLRNAGLAASFGAIATGCATTPALSELPLANDNPRSIVSTPVALPQQVKRPVDADTVPYDQQIFFYNAPPNPAPSEAALLAKMSDAQKTAYYMEKFCFRAPATPEQAVEQKNVYDAVEALSKLTYMGKPLVDLAAQNGLQFCSLQHMPNGIAAQYLPGSQTIVAGPLASREAQVMTIAHEIMHAAQDRNKLLNYETDWDIQSRVQRNLSIEAAALTMEFLVAYEAKLAGDPSYWNHMQHYQGGTTYNDDKIYQLIEDTYKKSTEAGATKEVALRAVGAAVWTHVFNSDDWRNFYLNHELSTYLRDISEKKFEHASHVAQNQFAEKTAIAGKVGVLPSFTGGVTFPALDSLLEKREKMKWAYQAADIARYTQMEGADGKTVATLRAAAVASGNPYLGLDLAEIYKRSTDESWTKGRVFRYTYHVMDEALKPPAPPPPAPANDATPIVLPPQTPVARAKPGPAIG